LNSAFWRRGELLFLPLGGAGEIGMNLNLYGYNDQWLMVDLGVTFGANETPGVDVVMPDPAFIEAHRDKLVGLVLTHAHEDHVGAVHHLWPRLRCPVWATPFTASILKRKLAEAGLTGQVPITVVDLSSRFMVGGFDIELITLTHSIPEPNALAIRTPVGTILHTGDWKFDPDPLIGAPSDEEALRRLGKEGVLALIGDSTNVFRPGEAGSEADVRAVLIDLLSRYPESRIAVSCFASNVARLESIALAAAANDRQVALVGRSLHRMVAAAKENGYLSDISFVDEEQVGYLPAGKTVLICTGSQGEPRAALGRIAADDHPHVTLEEGDVVVFSSRVIPGNEKAIGHLQDRLVRGGLRVITDQDEMVHVSGHPARDELARMYAQVRPQVAVPVHGELRHLVEHARLARSCQVPQAIVAENGTVVRLGPGEPMILDTVPTGRLGVDGNRLIRIDGALSRDRTRIAENGSVVATVVLDGKGKLMASPQITLHGLLGGVAASNDAMEDLSTTLDVAVGGLDASARRDDVAVKNAAIQALRRVTKQSFGRRPLVDVHVVRI
jgi:ribonuclease J